MKLEEITDTVCKMWFPKAMAPWLEVMTEAQIRRFKALPYEKQYEIYKTLCVLEDAALESGGN